MENLKSPKLRFLEFEGAWGFEKLSEVAEIKRGKSKHRPRNASFLYGGDYPFVQTGDIKEAGLYLTKYTQTYSEAGLRQSKLWDIDTLCITIAANIAETSILKIKACFPDSIIGLIPKANKTIALFVKHQFDKYKLEIQRLSQGVAQDNLNQEKLSEIQFAFPSLPEQTKIASFLTAVDEKLQGLKKKKTLLEQYKKGVMQQLFSRQLRFKDGNGQDFPDWEVVPLEEVFYHVKGKGIAKSQIVLNGKNECILYGELYTKYKEVINSVVSTTNEDDGLKSKIGDLLIPCSTTTTGIDLANATALNKEDVLLGGDITVLRTLKPVYNVFYAYYITNYKHEEIASFAQGSTIIHLYYSHFKEMLIDYLSLPEQTKIANFLSAIDEKINSVQQQIEKSKAWKKGLLQQMFV